MASRVVLSLMGLAMPALILGWWGGRALRHFPIVG